MSSVATTDWNSTQRRKSGCADVDTSPPGTLDISGVSGVAGTVASATAVARALEELPGRAGSIGYGSIPDRESEKPGAMTDSEGHPGVRPGHAESVRRQDHRWE